MVRQVCRTGMHTNCATSFAMPRLGSIHGLKQASGSDCVIDLPAWLDSPHMSSCAKLETVDSSMCFLLYPLQYKSGVIGIAGSQRDRSLIKRDRLSVMRDEV